MIAIFPEIAAAAADGQIELVSYLVRKYFGQSEKFKPRIDLLSLSRYLGITVNHATMKEFGLLAVQDEQGKISAKIFVTDKVSGLEKQFLIAHLLGHFFLDIQFPLARGDWNSGGFKEQCNPLPRYIQNTYESLEGREKDEEMNADRFAAALLLPKAMLQKAQAKIPNIDKLSTFFSVSPALLHRRLVACGYIEGQQANSYLEMESQISKRTNGAIVDNREDEVIKSNMSLNLNVKSQEVPVKPSPSSSSPIEKSLKMFRELAQKLDDSVDKPNH